MISAIETHLLPVGVTLPQMDREVIGGYFIWLTLPSPLLAEQVSVSAQEDEDLIIAPGPIFGVYGNEEAVDLTRNVRLCFSWEEEDKLAEGIQRLGRMITRLQKDSGGQESTWKERSGEGSKMMEENR